VSRPSAGSFITWSFTVDTVAQSISPEQFVATLGSAAAPLVLDVRREERFRESGRILPGAVRCPPEDIVRFASNAVKRRVVVYCVHGQEIGQQAAADLRSAGWEASYLQGGIEGLIASGLPTLRKRPDLGVTSERPSRWITRARPKIDRIACPWLVRRFIDPRAEFFYVPTERVLGEAKRLQAVAYDAPGAAIGHEGESCSFDALLRAFELKLPAVQALATIVRGADTGQPQLTPQSAGLLAFSLGLSQLHADDHAMLEAALPLYDALYAWCQAAPGESHGAAKDSLRSVTQ
jgi:rhodanese-related sulfurtransferase